VRASDGGWFVVRDELAAFPTGRIITMADRYQDRPFPADDDDDRGDGRHAPARAESDPLAELARLIGQTDPFAMGRANQTVAPRSAARDQYQPPEPLDDAPAVGPPPWMQRAAVRQEIPEQEYHPSAEHPLRRYATPVALPEPDYDPAPSYADADQPDPSRYDEALYGQLATGDEQQHDAAYADDAYAYQDGYEEGAEQPVRKRGGMMTVAVVAALAVLGTGAAFAYRTYMGSARSGDVPIIKADPTPTKIVPAPADSAGKVPDRMAAGDGTEKIVPREEVPVDINAKPGPRVVFPPLNQSGNPQPPMAAAAPAAPAAAPPAVIPNGVQPGAEPRKIKTIPVAGDPLNGGAPPAVAAPPPAKPAPVERATPRSPPPAANAPLSLSPQASEPAPAAEPPRTRMAAVAPAPAAAAPSGGGYVVQVSSQRNEADAQASFKALQGKFPAVLGSRVPLIKRADLGDKGVYYRAMVGPFGSTEEAAQFCGSLKTAGGQCVVQRN
jgi:hypothetical protein